MTFRFPVISLLATFLMTATGCGGGGGSSDSSAGITLDYAVIAEKSALSATQPSPAGVKTFTNSEGTEVTLDTAYLTVWSVELNNDCSGSFYTRLPGMLFDLIFPSAYAHADTTPTVLGTPYVIDINQADGDRVDLGTMNPPPDDYCGSTLSLFPADIDTENLPATIDMVDVTLYIEGSYTLAGGSPVDFILDISTRAREKGISFPATLTLNANNLSDSKTISLHYDRWFDGIDFGQLDSDTMKNAILENIRDAVASN